MRLWLLSQLIVPLLMMMGLLLVGLLLHELLLLLLLLLLVLQRLAHPVVHPARRRLLSFLRQ